jgi:hypothetical protein
MYFPQYREFGSALSKLRNFRGDPPWYATAAKEYVDATPPVMQETVCKQGKNM